MWSFLGDKKYGQLISGTESYVFCIWWHSLTRERVIEENCRKTTATRRRRLSRIGWVLYFCNPSSMIAYPSLYIVKHIVLGTTMFYLCISNRMDSSSPSHCDSSPLCFCVQVMCTLVLTILKIESATLQYRFVTWWGEWCDATGDDQPTIVFISVTIVDLCVYSLIERLVGFRRFNMTRLQVRINELKPVNDPTEEMRKMVDKSLHLTQNHCPN